MSKIYAVMNYMPFSGEKFFGFTTSKEKADEMLQKVEEEYRKIGVDFLPMLRVNSFEDGRLYDI